MCPLYWRIFHDVGAFDILLYLIIINFKMFQVASEHFYFWLIALKFFCEAESLLSVSCDSQLALDKQISDACAKYHKGITMLKVQSRYKFALQYGAEHGGVVSECLAHWTLY